MAFAQKAVSGFERLVTRSLAIVALAVAAGAAHSWMHGPLEPATQSVELPVIPPENAGSDTATNDKVSPENIDSTAGDTQAGDTQAGDTQTGDSTQTEVVEALPEGHITVAEAYDHFLNASADFIDARPADEYAEGHIPGALNLSLSMTKNSARVQDVLLWLDPSRPIIVYCRGGLCSEAKDVGRLLSGANFAHILIFADGFPGWKDAGYSVDTGSGG